MLKVVMGLGSWIMSFFLPRLRLCSVFGGFGELMRVPLRPIGLCPRPSLCIFPGLCSATCREDEECLAVGLIGMPARSSDNDERSLNVLLLWLLL